MSLSILIDLDDTLLSNDINTFLPAYLKRLSASVPNVDSRLLINSLLAATGKMIRNIDPSCTLEEAFDRAFYPAIGHTKADLKPAIDQFYIEVFPSLQHLTAPRPQAVQLIEALVAGGFRLAVATNPLFPQRATYHRLDWAGLSVSKVPFALVSTYEEFHFSKPNPAYFAEILVQMGCLGEPAVMIGNDLKDDILPAARFGLPGYLLSETRQEIPLEYSHLISQGGFEGILPWIAQVESAPVQRLDLEVLTATLQATAAHYHALSKKLDGGISHSLDSSLFHALYEDRKLLLQVLADREKDSIHSLDPVQDFLEREYILLKKVRSLIQL